MGRFFVLGVVFGGDFLLCFATRSVCLIFLIAVMKHHDQGQLKEDALSWGTAYSFGELVHEYGRSVAAGRQAWR